MSHLKVLRKLGGVLYALRLGVFRSMEIRDLDVSEINSSIIYFVILILFEEGGIGKEEGQDEE